MGRWGDGLQKLRDERALESDTDLGRVRQGQRNWDKEKHNWDSKIITVSKGKKKG